MFRAIAAAALIATPAVAYAQAQPAPAASTGIAAVEPKIKAAFEAWMQRAHVPGMVYGVVKDGRLVAVRGLGIQDTQSKRPVNADSRFRIASMSKAFTALAILKLRDEGKLSLDAPAETYVPEMKGWRYPTADSRRVRVADLLHHIAGYVEDNPWGDRQQSLPETDFTAMLKAGVAFAQPPGTRMEYSNLGYATLGRIVANVSGVPYQEYIRREIMAPLGMASTGYDIAAGSQERRAIGYRWQDEAWVREPDMADGAFGAMGGVETTANDYARWVAFLLSAWPARDGPDTGPVKRATVREIVEGANFVTLMERPSASGAPCRMPTAYAMGWFIVEECDLGQVVTHSGGYPGYGSLVMLLPEAGVGVFAFASRTYAGPRPVPEALLMLKQAGLATARALPVSAELAQAYTAAKEVWRTGDPSRAPLAVNVPLDRDLARRRKEIAEAKAKLGTCDTAAAITPVSALEGTFRWTCANGAATGRVQRAPTPGGELQVIDFAVAPAG